MSHRASSPGQPEHPALPVPVPGLGQAQALGTFDEPFASHPGSMDAMFHEFTSSEFSVVGSDSAAFAGLAAAFNCDLNFKL
jgi:hypothetical protein